MCKEHCNKINLSLHLCMLKYLTEFFDMWISRQNKEEPILLQLNRQEKILPALLRSTNTCRCCHCLAFHIQVLMPFISWKTTLYIFNGLESVRNQQQTFFVLLLFAQHIWAKGVDRLLSIHRSVAHVDLCLCLCVHFVCVSVYLNVYLAGCVYVCKRMSVYDYMDAHVHSNFH